MLAHSTLRGERSVDNALWRLIPFKGSPAQLEVNDVLTEEGPMAGSIRGDTLKTDRTTATAAPGPAAV